MLMCRRSRRCGGLWHFRAPMGWMLPDGIDVPGRSGPNLKPWPEQPVGTHAAPLRCKTKRGASSLA